jgi:hypothetical protein
VTTTSTTEAPDRVGTYDSVTAATVRLGSKTYSGTVASGAGDTPPPARSDR